MILAKIIKKVYGIFLAMFDMLLLLYVSLAILMQFEAVQTYFAKKLTQYLSTELQTEVSIDKARFEFFNRLVLNDFYVEDRAGDTLIFSGEFDLGFDPRTLLGKELNFGSLCLTNVQFNLKKDSITELLNLQFLNDYFSTPSDDTTSVDFELTLNRIEVVNGYFTYNDHTRKSKKSGFDPWHVDIDKLSLNGEDLVIHAGGVNVSALKLSLVSQEFVIKTLEGDLRITEELMELRHLFLQTEVSEIHGYYSMHANNWKDYLDFNSKVKFNTRFLPSSVAMKDLSYFAPILKGISDIPNFSGQVRGSVDNLHGKQISISLANHSQASLDFQLRGLPDIQETFFHFDIRELISSKQGIEKIPIPPFDQNNHLELPDNFRELGRISYSGKITGYLTDLVSNGHMNTAIGSLTTDIVIRNKDVLEYKGQLATSNFDAGAFLKAGDRLGKISLNAKLSGKGLSMEDVEARIDGMINRIEINGYDYHNLNVAGDFVKERFTGDFSVHDKNISLAFIGSIDLSKREKVLSFIATIDTLRPYHLLGMEQFQPSANFSSILSIDIVGRDIDSLVGHLNLLNTTYTDDQDTIVMENFEFTSSREGSEKNITLNSGLADFNIQGEFDMLDDFKTFKKIVQTYFPALVQERIKLEKNFDFSLHINDFSLIHQTFTPFLWLDSGTTANGTFNSATGDFRLNADLFGVKYNSIELDSCLLRSSSRKDSLLVQVNIDNYALGKRMHDRNISIGVRAANNKLYANFRSGGNGRFKSRLNLSGNILDHNTFDFRFRNSAFIFNDSIWAFSDSNLITIDSGNVTATGLKVHHQGQSLELIGSISDSPDDKMAIKMHHFDLGILNVFTETSGLTIQGKIDGFASVKNLKKEPLFESDLNFKQLYINEKPLGSGHIISQWNDDKKRLEVDGKLAIRDTNKLNLTGYYAVEDKESPLNFQLQLIFLPLQAIEPLTQGIIRDFDGIGTGEFNLTGTLSNPELRGFFGIANTSLTVDYLNTNYKLENTTKSEEIIMVNFTPEKIIFPEMRIVDMYGNTGLARLTFTHDYFRKFEVDLNATAKKLMVLNTNGLQNKLYYGSAFVTGRVNLNVSKGMTTLNIDVTAEDNTRFSLPLRDDSEVGETHFIEFEEYESEQKIKKEEEEEADEKKYNVDLRMKLRIQTGAEMRLVFDESIGDVVNAHGTGNLEILYTRRKGLEIVGEYEIVSGDYFFTLQSIINKRFYIERGSSIRWNGNPYLAELNILTSYKLRAKLANILPAIDQNRAAYEKKVPVDLRLKMTGVIESPVIGFDIYLPTSSETIRSQLRTELSNESCMNQQIFSLLVLNSFYPCESVAQSAASNTSAVKNSAYETLSNQLSNWLSTLSEDVDVGFSYRPEEVAGETYSPEQVEVALSTQLFNDRLIIDGNVGYGTQSSNSSLNQNTKDVVGEFTIEYKLIPDGKLRVKAFNQVNDRSYIENDNLYVQGVGISYRHDYESWGELFREIFGKKRKNKRGKKGETEEENPEEELP